MSATARFQSKAMWDLPLPLEVGQGGLEEDMQISGSVS